MTLLNDLENQLSKTNSQIRELERSGGFSFFKRCNCGGCIPFNRKKSADAEKCRGIRQVYPGLINQREQLTSEIFQLKLENIEPIEPIQDEQIIEVKQNNTLRNALIIGGILLLL